MSEEWRPILHSWEISSKGVVRNRHSGVVLKIRLRRDGYLDVKLNDRRFLVHRLVAMAFIPNPNGYPEVNHKNGVRHDARSENLEWVTPSQNVRHAFATGLRAGAKGELNGRNQIGEAVAREIMRRLSSGESSSKIARSLDVTYYQVANIKHGKAWAHLKENG